MKPHRILKGFTGSHTGNDGPHTFVAGTTAELSADLARIAIGEGWAKPVIPEQAKPATQKLATATEEPPVDPEVAEDDPTEAADEDEPEEKALEAAPANKMKKPPANKKK